MNLMKFKFDADETLGKAIAAEIDRVTGMVNKLAGKVMSEVAKDSLAKARDLAASRLHRTKHTYLNALSLDKQDTTAYVLVLDASARHLEEGYGPFDMKPGLLKYKLGGDALVSYNLSRGANADGTAAPDENGKRASFNGVRTSKDGYRYRAIPFEHSQAVASPNHPLHSSPVQKGQDSETTMGSLMADMKRLISRSGIGGITKGADGSPVLGKVASVRGIANEPNSVKVTHFGGQHGSGYSQVRSLGTSLGGSPLSLDSRLSGLTKYQFKDKGGRVRAAYMTFRMVSENPKSQSKWIHPGFQPGAKIFDEIEVFAEQELVRRLEELGVRSRDWIA